MGGPRGKSILHILLDGTNEDGSNENENHEAFKKCLYFIFDLPDNCENLAKIVNHADVSKNVPLHYATNYWDQTIIRKLFEYGAMSSVGFSNLDDEQPISKINPNVSTYSCNNITTTLIQISRPFYFRFSSKTNLQMMI